MIPEIIQRWLVENNFGVVQSTRPIRGGCINNGAILKTVSGETFFLKTNQNPPPDIFAREAEGLQALALPDGPAVPRPYLFGETFILMQDLQPASRRQNYWSDFGHKMASLHDHTQSKFGFEHDNYIGSTPQPNPWMEDGYVFFAQQRLNYQAQLAFKNDLLNREVARHIDALADRLPDLVPRQPASLIHGDLWGGNAMTDKDGGPAIIDPAAHYGWAEADLAMTALFGSFSEEFYQAYQEVRPLEPGLRDRFPLYNLYHLLNHLNLFGSGYLNQVLGIVRRYT